MRVEIIWPDGTLTTGSSWAEAERAIRAAQPRAYPNRRAFRRDLRRRAEVWSGRRPKPGPPWSSRYFIESLAAADLFVLNVTPTEKES